LSFDFSAALGPVLALVLAAILWVLTQVIGQLTIIPSVLANTWFAGRLRRNTTRHVGAGSSDRAWLENYVLCTFMGAIISVALSPTTIMFWQGTVFLHAAVLPFVLWVTAIRRSRLARQVRIGRGASRRSFGPLNASDHHVKHRGNKKMEERWV
jgi:hypothetical protein